MMERVKRVVFAYLLLIASVFLSGSVFAEGGSPNRSASSFIENLPENPALGSKLFVDKLCNKCHSILGKGTGLAPDLAKIKTSETFYGIAADMWNHTPRMGDEFKKLGIIRPELKPKEVSALVSFIYLLNFFDEPGDPQAGEALFRIKGCVNCHKIGKTGTRTVGPNLGKFAGYRSPVYVVTALWNRMQNMRKKQVEHGIKYPKFSGRDLINLISYIRQEGAKTAPLGEYKYIRAGNPKRGARLFKEKGCSDCHTGTIKGKVGAPDLTSRQKWGSLTEIGSTLWNHSPSIWEKNGYEVPDFEPEEMLDLLMYLYFIKYIDSQGDAETGKAVFNKRGCDECHTVGEGDLDGPDFINVFSRKDPTEILSEMWNHGGKMLKAVREEDRAWPRLEKKDLTHLMAFVESVRVKLNKAKTE